ncbi:HET-domain-containing protein [Decorospora gaudefroyi]|uniref:HET-domain-containing protein n=1 Tax=Decorospora gaudefroyi TaxID=184978 RepID=A0A6A5KCY8_9PLEO|nr:HET-domain-containing protein [Decorospora gaudefroyi]
MAKIGRGLALLRREPADHSLASELIDKFVSSNFQEPPRDYLPATCIPKLVTKKKIEAELKKIEEMESPFREVYPHDARERLATWICEHAPKCFAITLQCDPKDAVYLLLSMAIFEDLKFHDGLLPLADRQLPTPPPEHPYDYDEVSQVWTKLKIWDFCDKQWRCLVPEFSPEQYNYNLPDECIFPFTKLSVTPKVGAFGTVHKVLIHPDHQTGYTMQYTPRQTPGPNVQLILEAIQQLSGLADALRCLHNCKGGYTVDTAFETSNGQQGIHPTIPIRFQDPHGEETDYIEKSNTKSIRHGDLKPENILRFLGQQTGLGTLKIADMDLAKQHIVVTQDRTHLTSTRYGTIQYEAPEAMLLNGPRSRLYDVWSMGCITLEFIIWLLYGNDGLENFYNQLKGDAQQYCQYYEWAPGEERAEVHKVVRDWIKAMQETDPECSGNTALSDLLHLVREKLLVVPLPPDRESSLNSGKTLAPPAIDETRTRYRATARQMWEDLNEILSRKEIPGYLLADYRLPPLKDWVFSVDTRFAANLSKRSELLGRRFTFDDDMSALEHRAEACDFCKMLAEVSVKPDGSRRKAVGFERKQSNLLIVGEPFPVLSIFRSFEAELPTAIQLGFPDPPQPRTDTSFEFMRMWLEDCSNPESDNFEHQNCRTKGDSIPTRLIDVGTIENSTLQLVETQEERILNTGYIALSHPWGDPKNHPPFCTTRGEVLEAFKKRIPYEELPATFKDAIYCTQRLNVRYLWIDSICILQGDDGDFKEESTRMENVFSGAYCVLAASRAKGQRDGFLGPRQRHDFVTFQRGDEKPFYVCKTIDNFNKDVIEGSLNKRGWVLQERALARRTIYFTERQTYFECGNGIRCETLTKMHNKMASILGDPKFPTKAMEGTRAMKIAYFQGLYKLYSRLNFTRYEDRPFAIAGLEKRLQNAFGTRGAYGIFDDGDKPKSGLFHRSLLWQRGEDDDDAECMTPIDFPPERNVHVPSWSWMAYKGGIDYLDPPFQSAEWETSELIPPWTRGRPASTDSAPPDGQIVISATVRNFDVAGRQQNEVKFSYDTERRAASDGHRVQCVIVARLKEARRDWERVFYVLLVTPVQGITGRGVRVYERVGVGFMPGKFISLEGEGTKAEIV